MCLRAGFVVVTFDLRGHGRSGLVDGIPGYAHKFEDFTNDTAAVLQFAQERHPGMPSFLWGESMGGVVPAFFSPCAVAAHWQRVRTEHDSHL